MKLFSVFSLVFPLYFFLMYYCIVDHDFFLWTKIIIRAHNHHLLRTIDIFSKYIFLTIFPFFLFFLKISIIEFYACQKCNNFLVLPFLLKNCRIVKICLSHYYRYVKFSKKIVSRIFF